jgi:outer membrane lipoprotein-sorting protein
MIERNDQPMDLLDRAAAALRQAPVPDGPPPHVAAATFAALQAPAPSLDLACIRERRRKMFRLARNGSAAAAAALLLIVAAWLLFMDRTAPRAFADVVENVKNAKSVTFVTKIPTVIQGSRRGTLQQKWYVQGDSFRMEVPSAQEDAPVPLDAPPVLMAEIADAKQKKALQLDFIHKTAKRIQADDKTWDEMAKGLANPVEQLRKLKSDDAERLGEEELNGAKTDVYRLKKGDVFLGARLGKADTAKLWVDPKTGLPVRIAVEPPADSKDPTPQLVFEQFQWNQSLDPDLFKLDVPKGFSVEGE